MGGPSFSGVGALDAEVNDPVEGSETKSQDEPEVVEEVVKGGETESQEPEEVENLDVFARTTEEVQVLHQEPPVSVGEIDTVNEEVENENNSAADVNNEIGEQQEAENAEEDIYKWIEDVRKRGVVLRL